MEAVKIAETTKNTMKVIFAERCEVCGVRPKNGQTGYCDYCLNRYRRKQRLTPEIIDKSVIQIVEPLYANATMDDIEPSIRENLRSREPSQDLYLYGLPGRGKTFLMAALIRAYVGQGYECKRISFDDFCCQIRSTMSPASKMTEWGMVKPYKEVDMLFVDDLGLRSKQETDFAYISLYLILNKRQERLLPTFISSNKDLGRLRQSFDERIVSRLSTALIIEMNGEDRRKGMGRCGK